MLINEQFKEMVQKRYEEAVASNRESIVIDENLLGGLTLYIGNMPDKYMMSFTIEGEERTLYIGANESPAAA